jgi:hypothetical protein
MSNNVILKYDTTQFGVDNDGKLYILNTAMGRPLTGSTAVRTALTPDSVILFYDTDFRKCFLWNGTTWSQLVSTLLEVTPYINDVPIDGALSQSITAPNVAVSTSITQAGG